MKRTRKNRARLGKVTSESAKGKVFSVLTDRTSISFKRLWARQDETISVPLSEVLDLALNRVYECNELCTKFSFTDAGIKVSTPGFSDQILAFQDLFALSQKQRLLFS